MRATPAKSSRVVVPQTIGWRGRLAAGLIYAFIRAVGATVRFGWHDQSGQFTNAVTRPVIFCIWHNRLALSLMLYRNFIQKRQPARRLAAMVSASRDGGFLAGILEHFGVQPVRGSSSRRGPQALLELTSWAQQGFDLAITPDGPRGPRYCVQDGVIALGQLTGLPIVPVAYHLTGRFCLNSWDRFQVPLPFARCEVDFAEALQVPREATGPEREARRTQLEQVMKAITRD